MDKLSNLAISRILEDYPDDILRQFIKEAEKKLKNKNQYRLILEFNVESIITQDKINRENLKLFIKFLIKILQLDDFTLFNDAGMFEELHDIKHVLMADDTHRITYHHIKQFKYYKDYLSYFLENIDSYDDEYLMSLFYLTIVSYIILHFKHLFNKEDSARLYTLFNESDEKMPIFFRELIVKEGDYVVVVYNQGQCDYEITSTPNKLYKGNAVKIYHVI